jgi:hypothetical protein
MFQQAPTAGVSAPGQPKEWISAIVAATGTGFTALTAFGGETLVEGALIPHPSINAAGGATARKIDKIAAGGAGNFASVGAGISAVRVDRGIVTTEYFLATANGGDLAAGAQVTGCLPSIYKTSMRLKGTGIRPMATLGAEDIGQSMVVFGARYTAEEASGHIEYVAGEVLHTGETVPTPILAIGGDTTFPINAADFDGIQQWGVGLAYDGDQAADVASGVLLEGDGMVDPPERLPGPVSSSPAAAASGANVPILIMDEEEWFATKGGLISPSAVAGATAADAVIGVVLGFPTGL